MRLIQRNSSKIRQVRCGKVRKGFDTGVCRVPNEMEYWLDTEMGFVEKRSCVFMYRSCLDARYSGGRLLAFIGVG